MTDTNQPNSSSAASEAAGSDTTLADRATAATGSAKDLLAGAQTKMSEAITSAVDAAKGNPMAAAAIAAGAAATIAGAAFGVSKLREMSAASGAGDSKGSGKGH